MLLMIEKPRSTPAERGIAALTRAVRAVPTLLDRVVMGPFRWLENRRLLDTLAALSDRDLRDIGLSRGDIQAATARPVRRGAGAVLAGRRYRD